MNNAFGIMVNSEVHGPVDFSDHPLCPDFIIIIQLSDLVTGVLFSFNVSKGNQQTFIKGWRVNK